MCSGVVLKLLKKKKDVEIISLWPEGVFGKEFAERTEAGWQIFPDSGFGGPIYFSLIKKKASA